jgi:serine/threonine-protein phosphatase 2A regulatory subunit B''
MAAAIKMDELLVSWLGSDSVYENIMQLIENYRVAEAARHYDESVAQQLKDRGEHPDDDQDSQQSPRGVIPPFYPQQSGQPRRRRRTPVRQHDTWKPLAATERQITATDMEEASALCVRDQVRSIYAGSGHDPPLSSPSSDDDERDSRTRMADLSRKYLTPDAFIRITKDVCRFPSFFNYPIYQRILDLWNAQQQEQSPMEVITFEMFQWYWMQEMEPYDMHDRFYRLVKQPANDFIVRDDFLPFIKALLNDHPGLEFLSSHAEFQEKYAVTVITRIFYTVNKCHSGRITSRQVRRSDLLGSFQQVDEEEDINKVTRYFSYEHFYVLYCRFWELDHDRDYRITREDLLKYGDHSLSHMIVDRIFDAAPRPFEQDKPNREFLSYEDFVSS